MTFYAIFNISCNRTIYYDEEILCCAVKPRIKSGLDWFWHSLSDKLAWNWAAAHFDCGFCPKHTIMNTCVLLLTFVIACTLQIASPRGIFTNLLDDSQEIDNFDFGEESVVSASDSDLRLVSLLVDKLLVQSLMLQSRNHPSRKFRHGRRHGHRRHGHFKTKHADIDKDMIPYARTGWRWEENKQQLVVPKWQYQKIAKWYDKIFWWNLYIL